MSGRCHVCGDAPAAFVHVPSGARVCHGCRAYGIRRGESTVLDYRFEGERARAKADPLAVARAAFASLVQRDAYMLNRYGTGKRCPIILEPEGIRFACLVHEDGWAEPDDVRCSESLRLEAVAAAEGNA